MHTYIYTQYSTCTIYSSVQFWFVVATTYTACVCFKCACHYRQMCFEAVHFCLSSSRVFFAGQGTLAAQTAELSELCPVIMPVQAMHKHLAQSLIPTVDTPPIAIKKHVFWGDKQVFDDCATNKLHDCMLQRKCDFRWAGNFRQDVLATSFIKLQLANEFRIRSNVCL